MKVLQILPELNSGGVERGTLEINKYLVEQGHESLVVSNGGRLVEQLVREGGRHTNLPVHKKSLVTLWQVGRLRRLLTEEKPEILHLRSRVPAWVAWLAWRKLPTSARPRLVTTVHGFNSVNRFSKIMTCGERVIAVSESVKSYILDNYPDVSEERIRVINRGVDPRVYPYGSQPAKDWLATWHAQFPELDGRYVLTLPGRITRLKGHEDFFHILQGLLRHGLPAHGLVVGGVHARKGDYQKELQKLLAQMGLTEHVTFTGARGDMREIMAVSDVILSLTQQPESFGRTMLEGLTLGRPCLGYAHGGVAEQLARLLPTGAVPPGDVEEAIRRLVDWHKNPPAPSRDQIYTLEAMQRATVAVYRELLGSGK